MKFVVSENNTNKHIHYRPFNKGKYQVFLIPKCLHISWNGNYSDTLISCFHIFGLSCELKKKILIMQIRHILIFLPIV
jgi:hypothetical protein